MVATQRTSTIGYLVRATLTATICQMQIETVHISAHSELQDFLTHFKVYCLSGFLQFIADT